MAVELDPENCDKLKRLADLLQEEGKTEEAVFHFRKALELNPRDMNSQFSVAMVLLDQGKYKEATTHCRKAIEFGPKEPLLHILLAKALLASGEFREAREAASRVLALVDNNDKPMRQEAERIMRQAEWGERLPAVLSGNEHPGSPTEALSLLEVCYARQRYAEAARFATEAFAAAPELADDLGKPNRYNAACCAALAGCGKGEDAAKLGDGDRARLRRQALAWLRAVLAAYANPLNHSSSVRPFIANMLNQSQHDKDFAGVRDAAGLATLPGDERKEWEAFWAEVKAALANPPAK
jgi:tetratricopeptide (TPR) repeat protein